MSQLFLDLTGLLLPTRRFLLQVHSLTLSTIRGLAVPPIYVALAFIYPVLSPLRIENQDSVQVLSLRGPFDI